MVVESPGRLPGLIRAENIRYTHFSRNPKIAEFLKIYSFVKEYGEGVDGICKELEAAGLQAPEYYSKAFMLQAVIRNSNIEKPVIDDKLRGCEESLVEQLTDSGVSFIKEDCRQAGRSISVSFVGELYPEQKKAADKMLSYDIGILGAATAFG